jgi:DNA-binding protein Alba
MDEISSKLQNKKKIESLTRNVLNIASVDVAEITRRRFMNTLTVDKIEIGTEELKQEDGRTRGVSSIEIHLKTTIGF